MAVRNKEHADKAIMDIEFYKNMLRDNNISLYWKKNSFIYLFLLCILYIIKKRGV